MENRVGIIDFTEQGESVYVDLEVFDAKQNKLYRKEVRFLGNLLYGDFIHADRSPLTEECRQQTVEYLKNYFNR
ncbi:hypothetical protein [Planococcus salinarum]|uniref:hypothetical protein n=1 Tax=Planococcus salinarum TaxID=622695 RepID=UPI000E3CAAFB|nr:hypothetical protein [Planococcus salinarum]TAA72038.1 hypothetical protein D2909_08555 [Planococcus salinarum]